jgi:hypothetical protein
MHSSIIVAALAVTMAQAANHLVQVGAGGMLVFNPTSVIAANGDTVSFQFQGKNHSVTQSTFPAPCTKMSTPTVGVDSGFMFVPAGATQLPEFTIAVNDSTVPLWFYCAQTNPMSHCEAGMVFAINPTTDKTFAQFQQTALSLNTTANGTASGTSGSASSTGASSAGSAGSTGAPAAGPGGSPASVGSSSASGTAPASSSTAHSGAERSLRVGGIAAGVLTVAGIAFGLVL